MNYLRIMVLLTVAYNAFAMDILSILAEPYKYQGVRIKTKNSPVREYSPVELEQLVGALPIKLTNLNDVQTYFAHYLWASSNNLLANHQHDYMQANTTIDPCLRLDLNNNREGKTDSLRVVELLAKAEPLGLRSHNFEDKVRIVFLNNPKSKQSRKANRAYFTPFFMENYPHLLPNYQDILKRLVLVLAAYAEDAQIFIQDQERLTDNELARLFGVAQISPRERKELTLKSRYILNDINRLLNFARYINNNIKNIQVVDLYLFAEQSFHQINSFEHVLTGMLRSGHFFSDSEYAKNNPGHPQIGNFFKHKQAPLRSLYLMVRAIAFSLRDFADTFRASVGLSPIPASMFEQNDLIKAALRIDQGLPHTQDILREIRQRNSAKEPALSPQENEARRRSWLSDTLMPQFDKNRQKNSAKKVKKRSITPRKAKTPSPPRSKPYPDAEIAPVKAQKEAIITPIPAKESIGARIAAHLSGSDKKHLADLFSRTPDKLKLETVRELSLSVYKALVILNKAHRAAEFLKRVCDTRIFTKGKQEQFLSRESLEYHLLPYVLQNIVHPDFNLDDIIKNSPFLRERVLMEKVILHGDEIDLKQLASIEKNLDEGEAIIKDAAPSMKRILLVNLAHAWHKLAIATERAKSIEQKENRLASYSQKIIGLLGQVLAYVDQKDAAPVSVLEAYLLGFYLKVERSPKYERLSAKEIDGIKQRAKESMGDPRKKYDKTVHEVSPSGKKLGEHTVDGSIYHAVTNDELGDYIVVKFERPVKDRRIPLFVYYNDTIYRTDVFGGSRLKPNPAEHDFGSLIGVPLRAADFFNQWFTSTSSFWYGQRAFMPAEPNHRSKWAKGDIKIQTIPDSAQFRVLDNLIVQDGFGYIKKSLADDLRLRKPQREPDERAKYMAFQGLHGYDSSGRYEAVQELFEGGKRAFSATDFSKLDAKEQAKVLRCTLPKKTAIGLPVRGDDVVLPADIGYEAWAQEGLIIDKNPYSAKRSQVVDKDHVTFSRRLNDLAVFQYTMTGYITGQEALVGSFFKGLLAVIPDEYWPQEYRDSHILVSSKDQKLNQAWRSEDDKNKDQNNGQSLPFSGMISVKKEFATSHLIGLPVAMARALSGDYDGDPYDIMPRKGYQAVSAMIKEEEKNAIPSAKINKPFIPRESVGNFEKILDLRKPISADWNSINNRFNYLPPEDQKEFCRDMAKTNILQECLGNDWSSSAGLARMTEQEVVISEIQLGLKVGEDAYKADCKIKSIMDRDQDYQRALSKYDPDPSIPYGKGLVKKLEKKQRVKEAIKSVLNADKSANVVHKATRAMARFLNKDTTYDGFISDEEDEIAVDDE